jgi:2-polyprenyl-3-methyl-5-hydroxy-6-metoxy-1,4-benzoquinol methylase
VPHNIFPLALPDGTYYPDHLANKDTRPLEFLTQFNRVRDRDWADCTFMDLGCSEGSTTLKLSQMGSTVYGVEGRGDGVERAKGLKDVVGFENTHFKVGNVNDAAIYEEVDGIFNSGILYHLTIQSRSWSIVRVARASSCTLIPAMHLDLTKSVRSRNSRRHSAIP